MKIGTSGSYLEPTQWVSEGFKTIEHVAPQTERSLGSNWDTSLYGDDYEQIGNLTLLPTAINSSAGNKNWIDKWIYYRHVAEIDPDKLANLKQEAEDNRIKLKNATIDSLKSTSHKHHILPMVQLEQQGSGISFCRQENRAYMRHSLGANV